MIFLWDTKMRLVKKTLTWVGLLKNKCIHNLQWSFSKYLRRLILNQQFSKIHHISDDSITYQGTRTERNVAKWAVELDPWLWTCSAKSMSSGCKFAEKWMSWLQFICWHSTDTGTFICSNMRVSVRVFHVRMQLSPRLGFTFQATSIFVLFCRKLCFTLNAYLKCGCTSVQKMSTSDVNDAS